MMAGNYIGDQPAGGRVELRGNLSAGGRVIDAPMLILDPGLELFRVFADVVQESAYTSQIAGAELRGTCGCQLGHGLSVTAHALPFLRRRASDRVRVYLWHARLCVHCSRIQVRRDLPSPNSKVPSSINPQQAVLHIQAACGTFRGSVEALKEV